MRVLLTHTSTDDHAARIASKLAETLRGDGLDVTLAPVADAPALLTPFKGVMLIAAVHDNRHSENARAFVLAQSGYLNGHPSAFVSVCLDDAGNRIHNHADAQRVLQEFLKDCEWRPTSSITVEGPERSASGRWFTRLTDKLLSQPSNRRGPDGIDWTALHYFCHAFAEKLR